MRPVSLETELLGLLAQAPFLDRQEMAAISGGSRGAVYEAARTGWKRTGWWTPFPTRLTSLPRPAATASPLAGCVGWPQ